MKHAYFRQSRPPNSDALLFGGLHRPIHDHKLTSASRWLSFLSTFPLVIPFLFLRDARLALHLAYAVAIVMLFCCGYVFGVRSGLRPWAAGLSMVAVGSALVGVAVTLGG